MALLVLVVFVIGVLFGVHIIGASGSEAMLVLVFALSFLNSVLLYVLFTQILHVRDDIASGAPARKERRR